ncbi:MAG: hypothetical protein ACRECQ_15345 [Burkholderiaceae bacterium]
MITKIETTFFFATTVGALALAATIGLQELSAGPAVQQAITAPIIRLEPVQIVAERPAARAVAAYQAPEQVTLIR